MGEYAEGLFPYDGGVLGGELGDRVQQRAEREVTVTGAGEGGLDRADLGGPSQVVALAQDDTFGIFGAGRADLLLDDALGRAQRGGGRDRRVAAHDGVDVRAHRL